MAFGDLTLRITGKRFESREREQCAKYNEEWKQRRAILETSSSLQLAIDMI